RPPAHFLARSTDPANPRAPSSQKPSSDRSESTDPRRPDHAQTDRSPAPACPDRDDAKSRPTQKTATDDALAPSHPAETPPNPAPAYGSNQSAAPAHRPRSPLEKTRAVPIPPSAERSPSDPTIRCELPRGTENK